MFRKSKATICPQIIIKVSRETTEGKQVARDKEYFQQKEIDDNGNMHKDIRRAKDHAQVGIRT